MSFFIPSLIFLFLTSRVCSHADSLLGYTYPLPTALQDDASVQAMTKDTIRLLETTLLHGNSSLGLITPNANTISVQLRSSATNASIFEYYFAGSAAKTQGAGRERPINGDSVFRIGSVSKLLTVYGFLVQSGFAHWDTPIVDVVPELRIVAARDRDEPATEAADWSQVTIGSLCSQLSGIGRDYTSADLSDLPFPWLSNGLPPLGPAEIPYCGSSESQGPCSRQDYLAGFAKRHPVFAPYSTPIYSNAAFRILAYAIEDITGITYQKFLDLTVTSPLAMTSTNTTAPQDPSNSVIIDGAGDWDYDLGDETPTGGLYSSANDLSALARSILNSEYLTPSVTRRWMKPTAHTASLQFSVGAPWEIWRTRVHITSGRVIDLYTKSGSIGAYGSLFILIPEFKISLVVLTAGPDSSLVDSVAAGLIETFLPAVEGVAKRQACKNMCGTYVSHDVTNSSITISADAQTGLKISRWISNGSDITATAQAYSSATNGGSLKSIRIFPTNLVSEDAGREDVSYRAIFETGAMNDQLPIFPPQDSLWSSVDQLVYGKISLDEFVVTNNEMGQVHSIRACGLRDVYHRAHN